MARDSYPALKGISSVFLAVGWLAVAACVAGVVSVIGALFDGPQPVGGFGVVISVTLGCFIAGISWLATGELIRLLIDIERNTRALRGRAEPAAERREGISAPSEMQPWPVEPETSSLGLEFEQPVRRSVGIDFLVVVGIGIVLIILLLFVF